MSLITPDIFLVFLLDNGHGCCYNSRGTTGSGCCDWLLLSDGDCKNVMDVYSRHLLVLSRDNGLGISSLSETIIRKLFTCNCLPADIIKVRDLGARIPGT